MRNRIDSCFAELQAAKRKAFVAYITAGDPSLDCTIDLVLAMEESGVDIVELGVPFSDPLADGIVNQMAAQRAIEAGATLPKLLETIATIRSQSDIPLVLFTYLNPLFQFGLDRFEVAALEAGVDGLLVLDLPPDEDIAPARDPGHAYLARIRLIAPTTTAERLPTLTRSGSGFIYCVSREGVTGEQQTVSDSIASRVAEIKATTPLPVVVGFGISTPEQAATVAGSADGVVIGSAIVKQIATHGADSDLPKRIQDFLKPLAKAIHSA